MRLHVGAHWCSGYHVAWTSELKVVALRTRHYHGVVSLDKKFYSTLSSLHQGVKMDTSNILLLGVNL